PRLPVVGILARMTPEKGLVEALDELAANAGAWSHVRIAAPAQEPAYAAQVARRIADRRLDGRVEVLDWVEPAPFLDGVDAVLVPSTGVEGQPTVILEALARGRPVVVRSAMWSTAFAGLPVVAYAGARDLGDALAALPRPDAASVAEAARRFGAEQ